MPHSLLNTLEFGINHFSANTETKQLGPIILWYLVLQWLIQLKLIVQNLYGPRRMPVIYHARDLDL